MGPSRVYFDVSVGGIHTFAVDASFPDSASQPPPLPVPTSACPKAGDDEKYVHTFASFDGVVEVTPCRSNIIEFGPAITGILLHYADGNHAVLGQVRLDKLESPINVRDASAMWLHFSLSSLECPNVDGVTFEKPLGSEYFEVPRHGTLEWWFSHLQCQVWHEGRSSWPTKPLNRLSIGYY